MYAWTNLRKKQLATILGLSLAVLTITYSHQSPGAIGLGACLSGAVEARLKQRETALLGRGHAENHAQMRAHRCRVVKGLEKVATPDAQALAAAMALSSSKVGQWSAPFVIPVVGVTSVLLDNGNVLFWSYNPSDYLNPDASNTGVAYVWNSTTRTGHSITPPENIWCAGQTILSDGRVYLAGGNLKYPVSGGTGYKGSLTNYTFNQNPDKETFTKQPDMKKGRWYPSVTQTADNRAVITSGFDETGSGAFNRVVEVFTPATAIDGVGTVVDTGADKENGFYPFQYLMPDGKILQAGPYFGNVSLFTTVPPGATWSWNYIAQLRSSHLGYGNGITYTDASGTPVKQVIMIAGGVDYDQVPPRTISNNEWRDGFDPTAAWNPYPQWLQPRHNGNTVILPTGNLFTVGGNSAEPTYDSPLYESELYNKPANDPTGRWVQMAPNTIPAAYHSTAILLPDATVLLSEDDRDPSAASTHRVQVYSPPYMFAGSRPQITSAPRTSSRGQTISITANTTNIVSVVLIAPGATTHGNDMHQRFIRIPFVKNGLNLQATIPAESSFLTPPGYYMLFIVDSTGRPSVAKFVHVA